jgi:tetratricopeptide (TPR) repeat protein
MVSLLHAQSVIDPTVRNRAQFHLEKAEALMEERLYGEVLGELEQAYRYSFTAKERNSIIRFRVMVLMELQRFEDAIAEIEEREYEPECENEFLFMKAACLQRLEKIAEAIALIDTIIVQEHNPMNRTYLLIKEGLIFLSIDSLARAEGTFEEVLRWLGRSDTVADPVEREKQRLTHYALGFIALRSDAREKAKRHFAAVAQSYKEDEVGFKSRLYVLLIQGMENEEIDSLIMPEEYEGKERNEVSVLAGYLFYRFGSYQKAKDAFYAVEEDTALADEIRRMITILSAECCYLLKEYDEAIAHYRRYIEMVITAEEKRAALYGLLWSYYRSSKYSNAYAVAKDLLVLFPDSPYLAQTEQVAGLSLFYVGEHAQAKYHFSRLLALVPDLEEKDRIYYLRGKSKFYLKEYEHALDDFNTIVTHYPGSRWTPQAMNMIGNIAFEKEEYQEAYGMFRKLLNMDLSSSLLDEVRLMSERCLLHLGYYHDPIEMSKAYVAKYPNSPKSPDLLLEVCEYYFQLQRFWDAIREYERFLTLFPDDESVRFVKFKLAQSYSVIGYQEKALDINAELSKGDDEYAESSLVAMGDMLFSRKQFKESIEAFRSLTERFPQSNERDYANFFIGRNYLELNLPKEARMSLELVTKSKRIFPFRAKAHLLIAQTLYMEGRGEDYIDYLDGLIASGIGEVHAEAYFLKAEYKKETGRFKKAMELYEQAAAAFEEVSDKVRALYEAGLAAEELMLFDDAMRFYREALRISSVESAKYGVEERIRRIETIEGE